MAGKRETWGFSGAVANLGLFVGKRLTAQPRNTVAVWVKRIDDGGEREKDTRSNKEGDKNRVKCRRCH